MEEPLENPPHVPVQAGRDPVTGRQRSPAQTVSTAGEAVQTRTRPLPSNDAP